jgi:RNA polymerase sigma factor (sigma-70 family)
MGSDNISLDLRVLTDAFLLERFTSQRDEDAFAALVERYGPLVFRVCRRLLRHEEAKDAFQATFLVLARKAGSIRQHESVGSWLYGVAYRVALKEKASTARRREQQMVTDDLLAAGPAPEAAWRGFQPALEEEVSQLPPRYRAPVVLCYLEGKSTQEAAQTLGCPRGTVLSRLSRARERLRSRLLRRGLALSVGTIALGLSQGIGPALALPPSLASSTVQAATLFAAGKAAATGADSAQFVALTKGVLQAMFVTKLKKAALMLLVVLLAGAGALLFTYRTPAGQQTPAEKAARGGKGAAKSGKLLDGTWAVLSVKTHGREEPKEKVKQVRLIICEPTDDRAGCKCICPTPDRSAEQWWAPTAAACFGVG